MPLLAHKKRKSDPRITSKLYSCDICSFSATKRGDYNRHIDTIKHKTAYITSQSGVLHHCITNKNMHTNDVIYIQNAVMPTTTTGDPETSTNTSELHSCTPCGFTCKRQCDYDRHVTTTKHMNRTQSSHTQSTDDDNMSLASVMQSVQAMLVTQAEAHAIQLSTIIGSHAEAQAEQTKLLIEAISLQGPHTVTNNNNNTTNNNNQFNLNVFLNEDCKNAFTFKEVMESIVCTVEDLDRLIVDGYAATVIRKILESMQDMAITERPIHCTDLRRNTVCVKNATGWEKGEAALKMLNNSLYFVGKKLSNVVPEWRETYPDHFRGTDSRRNQYHTLIVEVLKVDDVKLEDRNVGIICKSLVLDRKTAKAGIM